eukprot:226054_1
MSAETKRTAEDDDSKHEQKMGTNGYPTQKPKGWDEIKNKEPNLTHFQEAINIIGNILINALPCSNCNVSTTLYVHGGCCRDLYLNRTINDVDIIVDTAKLQELASRCTNDNCVLKKQYDNNTAEYNRIKNIKRYDLRLNQWMTSEKIINAKWLLQFINSEAKKDNSQIVGIKDNSKRLYVVAFVIYCQNGIDIDFMDNTFYADHGYLEQLDDVGPILNVLDPLAVNLGWKNYGDILNEELKKKNYRQNNFENDIKNRFKDSVLVSVIENFIFNKKSNLDAKSWQMVCDKGGSDEERVSMIDYGSSNRLFMKGNVWGEFLFCLKRKNKYWERREIEKTKNELVAGKEYDVKEDDMKEDTDNKFYDITHALHCEQADCTFNALYFELYDVVNKCKGFNDEEIKKFWMSEHVMKDPCKIKDDDKTGGLYDVTNGIVCTYKGKANEICQSQPEMIMYRTIKNAYKLATSPVFANTKQIIIGKELVDAIRESNADLFRCDRFGAAENNLMSFQVAMMQTKEKLGGTDRSVPVHQQKNIIRHIFTTYNDAVDIETRLNLFNLLNVSTLVVNIWNTTQQPLDRLGKQLNKNDYRSKGKWPKIVRTYIIEQCAGKDKRGNKDEKAAEDNTKLWRRMKESKDIKNTKNQQGLFIVA